MQIIHHGAHSGVTGSCHELRIQQRGILIDCGLFQGDEKNGSLDIEFPVDHIDALLLTHCHIDHVGRIPWLLAAGFRRPIYASEATAALLPLMLDDALKIQLKLGKEQRSTFINLVSSLLRPVPFNCQAVVTLADGGRVKACFRQAGHILGSAYIELELADGKVVVFSGDLGPCDTPLLVDPVPPQRADTLVIESTYGDRLHDNVTERSCRLAEVIAKSLVDGGSILIPSFSVGRTQELLFDIEMILSEVAAKAEADAENQKWDGRKGRGKSAGRAVGNFNWSTLPIILDSPLAGKITEQYEVFQRLWAKEAKHRVLKGHYPLSFSQCVSIESHEEHIKLVNRLRQSGEPAVVIAASGMCEGGRIVNYLKALLPDPRTDVVFIGYQAWGTTGRALLEEPAEIDIQRENIPVKAKIHQISGYSAHADQADLLKFVEGIEVGPEQIRVVHGDAPAQQAFAAQLRRVKPDSEVVVTANIDKPVSLTS